MDNELIRLLDIAEANKKIHNSKLQ